MYQTLNEKVMLDAYEKHLLSQSFFLQIKKVDDQDIEDLKKILNTMDISQAEGDADKLAVQNRIFHRRMEQISDKKRILRVIDSQEEYIKMFSAMAIASIVTRTTAHQERDRVQCAEDV